MPVGVGAITDRRGQTVLPISWKTIKTDIQGNRLVEGIAYNAAIRGERTRVTCSDKVWNDPDDDVFYWDEAIRWTVNELEGMDLWDVPMRIQHTEEEVLPSVGKILENFVDSDGHLHIVAEVPCDSDLGKAAISLIDNGTCAEFSVGYGLYRDPVTKEVKHGDIDEVSFVTQAHFRGCKVGVRAGKRDGPANTQAPYTAYRTVRGGAGGNLETGKMANNNSRGTPASTESRTGERMASSTSETAAAKSAGELAAEAAAKEFDASLPPGSANEDLVRHIAMQKKKFVEKARELADAKAKLESFESEKKRAKDEYAERVKPQAEEVVAALREIAEKEANLKVKLSANGSSYFDTDGFCKALSADWEQYNKSVLTDSSPLGQEMQAVQVACARGWRRQQEKIKELTDANNKLNELVKTGAAMLNIEETDFEEDQRSERRDLKAARRNADAAAAAPKADVPRPDWVMRFASSSAANPNQYERPTERRNVAAAAAAAPSSAKKAAAAAPEAAVPQQQQQQYSNYVGMPNNSQSCSRNPQNSEFFGFLHSLMGKTDHTTGALAPLAGANFSSVRI